MFEELPILHTSDPIAQSLDPAGAGRVELALDWQRLLHLYAYLRRTQTNTEVLDLAMKELSAAGVTSEQARKADPGREGDYREAAREWVRRYKESRKKKKKAQRKKGKVPSIQSGGGEPSITGAEERQQGENVEEWTPTVDEIEHLIALLETNSHSRDEKDQLDLRDPRSSDVSVTSAKDEAASEADEDDKDEACGLWLVASLMNHSCLPNCTVVIPPSQEAGTPPKLTLRCIRPIDAGDSLTISYHDEEMAQYDERQSQLSGRGFTCACLLCNGGAREYTRAAACGSCATGSCCPQKIDGVTLWKCDRCSAMLDESQVKTFVEAEEAWMSQWEVLLGMISGEDNPSAHFPPLVLLESLTKAVRDFKAEPSNILDVVSRLETGMAPLHITHGHIYAFLKFTLFEQSFWLRSILGSDGVTGVLFAMCSIVERALGPSSSSDERRVLGYWLAKEGYQRLGQKDVQEKEKAMWERCTQDGFKKWKDGMQTIYGIHVE